MPSTITNNLKRWASDIKDRARYYRARALHPRCPRLSKWLILAALAYALSPIDLIPDWIPILGYLDDLIIVPGLIALALRLIPQSLKDECRTNT